MTGTLIKVLPVCSSLNFLANELWMDLHWPLTCYQCSQWVEQLGVPLNSTLLIYSCKTATLISLLLWKCASVCRFATNLCHSDLFPMQSADGAAWYTSKFYIANLQLRSSLCSYDKYFDQSDVSLQ